MRISIDATPLLLRSAGVKNYIYHWLVQLCRQAGKDGVVTFPFFTRFGELDHERSIVGWPGTVWGLFLLHALNGSRLPWTLPGVHVFHSAHACRTKTS